MGMNTTILIRNDGLGELERHPDDFVRALNGMIQSFQEGDISVGQHANPVQVMRTQHADVFRLYATHGNSIVELSKWSEATKELASGTDYERKFLKRLLDDAQEHITELRKIWEEG